MTLELSIIKGNIENLGDCTEALLNSEIGKVYFSSKTRVRAFLSEGLRKGEIFVAMGENDQCVGYIWFTLAGAFYKFPYVLNIAIKRDFRRRGIGKKLLKFFEEKGFEHSSKLFLVVSSFNIEAKKWYQEMGYQEVGLIPDLLKEGIAEYIMMKSKETMR